MPTFWHIVVIVIYAAVSAFVVRWTKSPFAAIQWYLVSLWMLYTGFGLLVGGMTTPAFPAYSVLILGATFLAGRQSGVVWTAICIVSILVVWQVRGRWIPLAEISPKDLDLLLVLAVIAILSLVCLLALLYDRAKNQALAELRQANERTSQMIVQLEHASQRLVSSSEKFLGSHDADQGLVGQMLQKARDGRTAMEQSQLSISGMIDQYRQISSRVQRLYEQSTVIVEIVDTIDRISDRLDLMALNVGIEAAHGGESGKQFSILAGDMRLLAERVLKETRQIKRALRQVQKQVGQVLESSVSGQELTEESAQTVSELAATLDDIYRLIEEAQGATGQMTADTLDQINAVRNLVSAAVDTGHVA